MRRGAGSERRLLRALRRAHEARPQAGPRRDPGRGAVFPDGGGDRDRLHLDVLRPEIASACPHRTVQYEFRGKTKPASHSPMRVTNAVTSAAVDCSPVDLVFVQSLVQVK